MYMISLELNYFFLRSEISVETFCMDATFFGKSRFNNFLLIDPS